MNLEIVFEAVMTLTMITVSVLVIYIGIKDHYESKKRFAESMRALDEMERGHKKRIRDERQKTEDLRVELAKERVGAMETPKFRMIR